MNNQKRLLRDHLQNFLIVILSASAIYLFILTQSVPLNLHLPEFSLSPAATEDLAAESSFLQELNWPVTLVVCDDSGQQRYQQLSTADNTFTSVEGLWEELFREGYTPLAVSLSDYQQALSLPGIYVSFPTPVPSAILSERLGLSSSDETLLQHLLLSIDDTRVRFLFWDGSHYFFAQTDLSAEEVSATAEILSGQPCSFAFDQEGSPLHPLTVLPAALPQYALLSAVTSTGTAETGELLTHFGFNAHTTNRYTESSGTEVIVEAPRKFSIAPNGRISYLGSASHAPDGFVLSTQASPTLSDLVDSAYALLSRLPVRSEKSAQLYLSHAEYNHSGNTCLLRFSYMLNGLPLVCGDGEPAAELLIEDGVVVNCSFLCRDYTLSDSPSLLLPLQQAQAIAEQYEGMEMALSYVDNGGDSVSVSWLMR